MRLFIAGLLSLVIYLLTCAYGNEEKAVPEIQHTPVSVYQFNFESGCWLFHPPYYPIMEFPCFFETESHNTEVQTFPDV